MTPAQLPLARLPRVPPFEDREQIPERWDEGRRAKRQVSAVNTSVALGAALARQRQIRRDQVRVLGDRPARKQQRDLRAGEVRARGGSGARSARARRPAPEHTAGDDRRGREAGQRLPQSRSIASRQDQRRDGGRPGKQPRQQRALMEVVLQ